MLALKGQSLKYSYEHVGYLHFILLLLKLCCFLSWVSYLCLRLSMAIAIAMTTTHDHDHDHHHHYHYQASQMNFNPSGSHQLPIARSDWDQGPLTHHKWRNVWRLYTRSADRKILTVIGYFAASKWWAIKSSIPLKTAWHHVFYGGYNAYFLQHVWFEFKVEWYSNSRQIWWNCGKSFERVFIFWIIADYY